MCVPLLVRGTPIGAVGFMRVRPGMHFTLSDLALAEEFTDRAAVAIDNAMLYTKEQEANRLKDDFLSIVSHELKTPLTPILGAMYRLRSIRPNDADVQNAADMVERNAKRQSRIIDDLLDISRLATGKCELDRRSSDIGRIVQAAVHVARPAAEAMGVSIEVDIVNGMKPIWCDPDRIQQVLWNLVSNAISFSRRGGRVLVRTESIGNAIRISVTDEGEGISPEFLPHVFEKFRQAGQFTTRKHGGLGLGLSIVRHIVGQHGGRVWAESAGEDKGSTFIVELPYPQKTRERRTA
jgi:signal transduction histidine kinase